MDVHRGRKEEMKTIQAFSSYLPQTQNWAYRLIKNLPDAEVIISAETLTHAEAFPVPGARFITPTLVKHTPDQPWPIRKAMGAVNRLSRALWRRALVREAGGADILHAHFSFVGWDYLWLAKTTGIPLAVSFYGYDYERLPMSEPVWRDRYVQLFRGAAVAIAEGSAGREKLIGLGCPPEKAFVARLGVETGVIPVYKRTKPAKSLRLLQIASFTEKKGHRSAVLAFAKASKMCPGMTLTLVGRDTDGIRDGIAALIGEHGLGGAVEIIDGIDFSLLHEFLGRFDVFIHPSRHAMDGDCEGGAPVVLLDAQATGMPVISTTHCDIPDEVLHGETGLLTGEDDIDGLAESIVRFYDMGQAEYAGFCQRARLHVEKNFEATVCSARLMELYRETTARWPRNLK